MSRALDDLDPNFKPIAMELLARSLEKGIPLVIIDTLRTLEEQAEAVKNGFSSTLKGKHLPQPPSGKSKAMDVCPYLEFQLHGPDKLQWDASDPIWQKVGVIGESLGLRWGGRWKQPHDPGHFETVE